MDITDTHCHLDVAAFDSDRADILVRCQQLGIKHIIVPGIQASGWDRLLQLCQSEKGLYPALGLHPVFLQQHQQSDITLLEKMLAENRVVAVGEIGLDFYIENADREQQIQLFEQQLQLAKEFELPVILHVRKAHDTVLQLLKKNHVKGGFAHAFNGSLQQAQQYIDLGFKLGFGGTLTWPNSKKIHQLATTLPIEAIVLETDAPDMVVASHRGERNSPEYIVEPLQVLSELRELSMQAVADQTSMNASEIINFY